MYLFQKISSTLTALANTVASGNSHWEDKHTEALEALQDKLPSGSGFDAGTKIDLAESSGQKIVLTFGYHHMNQDGFYIGWTHHTATITPNFGDFDLEMTTTEDDMGEAMEMAGDYIEETVSYALMEELNPPPVFPKETAEEVSKALKLVLALVESGECTLDPMALKQVTQANNTLDGNFNPPG